MGLKTTNYEVKEFGISLPNAYAQITNLSVDLKGSAQAIVEIQQTRADIGVKNALDRKIVRCDINKERPVHEQVYIYIKENLLNDWEDDIVEEKEGSNGEETPVKE